MTTKCLRQGIKETHQHQCCGNKQIARLVNKLIEIHALTPQSYTKIFVVGSLHFLLFPTTFMLMGLLNSLAQALRRHSWISSFRTPSGKRHIIVVVIVVVGVKGIGNRLNGVSKTD